MTTPALAPGNGVSIRFSSELFRFGGVQKTIPRFCFLVSSMQFEGARAKMRPLYVCLYSLQGLSLERYLYMLLQLKWNMYIWLSLLLSYHSIKLFATNLSFMYSKYCPRHYAVVGWNFVWVFCIICDESVAQILNKLGDEAWLCGWESLKIQGSKTLTKV